MESGPKGIISRLSGFEGLAKPENPFLSSKSPETSALEVI